jgi:O-antigen ligase
MGAPSHYHHGMGAQLSGCRAAGAQADPWLPSVFAALFGGFLGLTLLKFGNPPIMEKWVMAPTQFYEFAFGCPWPIVWGYWMLGLVGVVGVVVAWWRPTAPRWLIALPLVWLLWEFLAGTQSVHAGLTAPTLKHFAACVLCFYLGLFSLSRLRNLWPFWTGLLCGLVLVLMAGWEQHFGGLQETRRYFYTYLYAQMAEVPPEYLKRISSERIFATLFYPNALAGVLLLLLPASLAVIWEARRRLTAPARGFLVVLLGAAGLACLYWSGSKGGWLLMLLLGLIVMLRLPFGKQFKIVLIAAVLLGGLTGFFWKYSGFFQKGATSVSARFDYWRAALQTAREKPLFGTGPGTFAIAYEKIKRPESEMSRLVHNDYLEQASDSGVVGFVTYAIFIVGCLVWSFKRRIGPLAPLETADGRWDLPDDWLGFAVWLGLVGWSLQGLVEFGLYIPASAWSAFASLGWLLGRSQLAWTSPGGPGNVPSE